MVCSGKHVVRKLRINTTEQTLVCTTLACPNRATLFLISLVGQRFGQVLASKDCVRWPRRVFYMFYCCGWLLFSSLRKHVC
jgi:hypothetical protein